jgi:hypothetical protein
VSVVVSLHALEEAGALGPTGLRLHTDVPYDQYEAVGVLLGKGYRSLQWAVGDWLILGETLYGDRAYQASEVLEMSPEGRSQYLRCAFVYPPNRRRAELSWSHHRTLIALEPEDQDKWLNLAIENRWSNHELHDRMRAEVGPVNRGRGASATQPKPEFDSRLTVVESVYDSAREVVLRAEPLEPGAYRVPLDALRSLAHALALPPLADAPTTIGGQEEAA